MLNLSAKKKWLPLNVIKAVSQKFVHVHGKNSHGLLDVLQKERSAKRFKQQLYVN